MWHLCLLLRPTTSSMVEISVTDYEVSCGGRVLRKYFPKPFSINTSSKRFIKENSVKNMDYGICVLVRMYEASGFVHSIQKFRLRLFENNNNNNNYNDISKAGIMNFLKSSLD